MSLTNFTNRLEHNELVLLTLKNEFGEQLDIDTIEFIAYECDYDLDKSHLKIKNMLENGSTSNTTPFNIQKRHQKPKAISNQKKQLIEAAVQDIQKNYRVLVLLRGLPGSGKSTLATKILQEGMGNVNFASCILSADDYFISHGTYKYDISQLSNAHEYTKKRAYECFKSGFSPVVIDNTNTQLWELRAYCCWAVENCYLIHIVEPTTKWAFNVSELTRRNRHKVPKNKIEQMLDRYEKDITVEKVFRKFKLKYTDSVPKYRSLPLISSETHSFDNPQSSQNQKKVCKDVCTSTRDFMEGSTKIASSNFVNFGQLPPQYPKMGHFDKGCNTDNLEDVQNCSNPLSTLKSIFENIPEECLEDILQQCGGDMQWAVGLLAEGNYEILQNVPFAKPTVPKTEVTSTEPMQPEVQNEKTEQDKKQIQEEANSLKTHLESSFVINTDYYSDHLKKLKGLKAIDEPQPGPSNEDFIMVNDESDPDDFYDCLNDSDSCNSFEELLEMNLSDAFVKQLQENFGDPDMQLPQGFQPIIEIPKSLGKELYALYLESVFKQMDAQKDILEKITLEDELLAKKLQAEEFMSPPETPNLREIMINQKEASKMKKLADLEWQNLAPDDLAFKLTKQKLVASFPHVSEDTLMEILAAHHNNFNETKESLQDSGALFVENTISSPVNENVLDDMRLSHHTTAADLHDIESCAVDLRNEAEYHLKARDELRTKAQRYFGNGMPEVASFFSGLARTQTKLYERTNSLAVQKMLEDTSNKGIDTLDLHYLKVSEAMIVMDKYLDECIARLNSAGKNHILVFVITGRGKNSTQGIAKIRPAVEQRLRKRTIKFVRVNPGLIRIKVVRNTKPSNQIP